MDSPDFTNTNFTRLNCYQDRNEPLVPWVLRFEAKSFADLVERLHGFSRGVGVPEGFVEHTTYWLIDSNRRLVGVSNLRHRLTPMLREEGGHIGFGVRPSERRKGYATKLLALTLREAGKLGIEQAMLTCDKNNVASATVIQKNGGVLDSEYPRENRRVTQKYWIDITE